MRLLVAQATMAAALLALASMGPVAAADSASTGSRAQATGNTGNDSDGDGMPDIWETNVGLDPFNGSDAVQDYDGDGLDNLGEFTFNLDPNSDDSDQDGLTDGEELNSVGSDPRHADTDGDRITDFWEVFYSLNPLDPADASSDMDGDGYTNLEEVLAGTDPCDISSSPIWETPADVEALSATPPVSISAAKARGSAVEDGGPVVAANCKPDGAVSDAAISTAAARPDVSPQSADTSAAPDVAVADTAAAAKETTAIDSESNPAATGMDSDSPEPDRKPEASAGAESDLDLLEATTLGLNAGDADLPAAADGMASPETGPGMAMLDQRANMGTMQIESPVPGHERVLSVPVLEPADDPALAPIINGRLDDAAWQQASASTGFWNSIENGPPTNQTEVFVMMDDEYLYFGFRAYDDQVDAIEATRTVRDTGLGYDDSLTVELDTFFNRRDISKFSLNPLGTQSDDPAGGRSAKIEWKGDWQGAATKTDYGWEAEFAIPFSILNFNPDANQFGVNFRRYQSRTKEYTYWADITPQSLAYEMGQLSGLNLPSQEKKKVWSFMPFALAGKNIPDKEGEIQDALVTAGVDIRWQPRPDLTGMLALNPDFSQVEEAVTDISFSYNEKAVEDNRPFFIEGRDLFSSDNDGDQYFYSNRVPDFDVGAKSFGRSGRNEFGVLATLAPDDRVDFAARTLYEVDDTNSAIGTAVATNQTDFDNILLVGQYNGRQQDSGLNYAFDVAYSDTSDVLDPEEAPEGDGAHYAGTLGWNGDYFYAKGEMDKYETSYFPGDALLDDDLPGTSGLAATTGYYREMSHPLFQQVDSYIGARYRQTDIGEKQQEQVYVGGNVEFNNDMRLGLIAEEGPYRPVTDERGVFEDETNNDRFYGANVDFNTRSSKISGGLQYNWGNLGGGPYKYYSAYGWWRPVNPVYFSVSAERTDSFGIYDQIVTVAAWNITPQNALAGRYIYSAGENIYRLAYSYRPRKGLDIFAVFDTDTTEDYEFSVKIVKIF